MSAKFNPDRYAPQTGRIIGEDGRVYNIVDLLRSGGGAELLEQLTEKDAVNGVVTFSGPIKFIDIMNLDPLNAGTFEVNGLSITVPPIKGFRSGVGVLSDSTVTVSGSSSYIISRLG